MKTFTLVFRTGGTENAKWHRTLAFATKAEAMKAAEENRRMGFHTLVHETSALDAVGMPEGFDCASAKAGR